MDALPQWLRKSEPKPRFWASFQRLFIPSLHLCSPGNNRGGRGGRACSVLTRPPCLFGSTADRPGLSSFSGQRRGTPPILGQSRPPFWVSCLWSCLLSWCGLGCELTASSFGAMSRPDLSTRRGVLCPPLWATLPVVFIPGAFPDGLWFSVLHRLSQHSPNISAPGLCLLFSAKP